MYVFVSVIFERTPAKIVAHTGRDRPALDRFPSHKLLSCAGGQWINRVLSRVFWRPCSPRHLYCTPHNTHKHAPKKLPGLRQRTAGASHKIVIGDARKSCGIDCINNPAPPARAPGHLYLRARQACFDGHACSVVNLPTGH